MTMTIPSWMNNAPGTPCEACYDPRSETHVGGDISFPENEPIFAVTLTEPDGVQWQIAATASGWTFGDEKAWVAICPAHSSETTRDEIRQIVELNAV